jgi:hypothetical protein
MRGDWRAVRYLVFEFVVVVVVVRRQVKVRGCASSEVSLFASREYDFARRKISHDTQAMFEVDYS